MSHAQSLPPFGFQLYQEAFTAYIRNPAHQPIPAGADRRRMKVYADIVLNNIESTISACYPVCKLVLGKRIWHRLIKAFLSDYASSTPIFREIPEQFLHFLTSIQISSVDGAIQLPRFLNALAHYEWVELKVSIHPEQFIYTTCSAQALLKLRPIVNPTLLNLSYDYPVHTISPKRLPKEITLQPVHLLIYRTAAHEIKFVETNPMTAALITLLMEGKQTGEQALHQIVKKYVQENAASVMVFGEQLLTELHQKEVLIGIIGE